ncbi:hypothetical protein ACS0TY_022430 [Phlomoides rotata]
MEKTRHITSKPEMMTLELLKVLPSEIKMTILSKLPVRTIIICKCVCKSWLHLIETQAFVKLHLSTSVPGLVTLRHLSRLFEIFEVEDGRDVEHHDHHYNLVTKFNFPCILWMCGSVDGLLWLHDRDVKVDTIYICNPITRDYIRIHSPPEFPCTYHQRATYGFGSCKMAGQYKVVRILCNESRREEMPSIAAFHVYTLGTGSRWRRLAACAPHCVSPKVPHLGAAFVNGNLHWLGCDSSWISCFDLETESFSTFSAPQIPHGFLISLELFAWGESLCLHESTLEDDKVVIWLMEEYGNVKSWTKKLVFNCTLEGEFHLLYELHPLKVFKDGDILMEINNGVFFYYCNKTKTIQEVDMFKVGLKVPCYFRVRIQAIVYAPSFRSLKSLGMENVISF